MHASSTPLARSRHLRAALMECLRDVADGAPSEDADLRAALTVWSFVEAVYLAPSSDSSHVSARLADWHALSFPALIDDARDALDASPGDEDAFWALVARLAGVGLRGMALRMISARIAARGEGYEDWAEAAGAAAMGAVDGEGLKDPLVIAESLLAECPIEIDASATARQDVAWRRWQDGCADWAESCECKGLVLLLKVLSGSTAHMATACASWVEMLVATCTYGKPMFSDARFERGVVEVENACAEASAAFTAPHDIAGGALIDAAVGQPAEAVVRMAAALNTTWYAAHLCDLLMQAGQIAPEAAAASKWMPAPGGVSLLEYLVLEYAKKLERNRGLWRIAADYYTQCPRSGRRHLKEMLRRVPTAGAVDPVAEKLVKFCDAHNLDDVAKDICARVGAECFQVRNFGGAVYWYARCGRVEQVSRVVENAIAEAEIGGSRSASAIALAHVVSAAAATVEKDEIKERITYADVYVKFQGALASFLDNSASAMAMMASDGLELDEAQSELLHDAEVFALQLLCGGGLPRRFWLLVVHEMCSVLRRFPAYMSVIRSDAVYEMMGALEVVENSSSDPKALESLSLRLQREDGAAENTSSGDSSAVAKIELRKMRQTLLKTITASFAS